MTNWRNFFSNAEMIEAANPDDSAFTIEEIYQAFKARLCEELGIEEKSDFDEQGPVNKQYFFDKKVL